MRDNYLEKRRAIAADIANKESLAKSTRIQANKNAVKEKIRAGIPVQMKLPFWLKWDDGKYVFDERKSIVDEIVTQKRLGVSVLKIATYLNKAGIPSIQASGGSWTPSTINTILHNPILYGAHQLTIKVHGKYQPTEIVQNYYPACVTYSEHLDLISTTRQRPAGASQTNHISGLVYCGCCGKKMSCKTRNNKNATKTNYYHCRYAFFDERCPNKTNFKNLYKSIISNIHHLEVKQQFVDTRVEDEIKIKLSQIERRIVELTSELSKLNSSLPVSAVMASLSILEQQKHDLIAELKTIVNIAPNAIQTLMTLVDEPKAFNMEIKKIVESITVTPAHEGHSIKVQRFDGHSITFRTKGIFKKPNDTEKFLKMVEGFSEEE